MHSLYLNIILQFIESLVCFDFYNSLKFSSNKLKKCGTIIIGYIVMCIINVIFNYNFVINAIFLTIFQFCFAHFLFEFKIVFSLIYSVFFTCLVSITELTGIESITLITNGNSYDFINNPQLYVVLIVISKSLLFIILRVISNIFNKFKSNERIKLTGLIYPISLFLVLMDFGVVLYVAEPSNKIRILLAVSSLVLSITIITTCIFQQLEAQKEKELLELKTFQQEQEINQIYFELLEHQNEELQIFVHDTKKHFHNLYALLNDIEKSREYIESIVQDIDKTNKIGKTKNKLLDLIVEKYDFICEKKFITFEKNIHQSNLSFIEEKDLTSIFNNLFDNAIEAANNSKIKYISFSLNKIGKMLVVDIKNSCDTEPKVRNNHLISIKENSPIHGYGFKSVSRTVKKYNADLDWEYDSNKKEFSVSVIFPIENA